MDAAGKGLHWVLVVWLTLSCWLSAETRAGPEGFVRCPTLCVCQVVNRSKRVTCDLGGLSSIPTSQMDKDIRVLVVTAPPEHPNDLTIGRFFMQFTDLEEIRITYSNAPAIGESSFWPGRRLQILDLSHNNISLLKDSDFNGLSHLRVLNLSYNCISTAPSAPFRYLSNLTSLFLAHNKLETLAPRFFYMLKRLQRLDLSGNPLRVIDPEHLKDVRPLRVLSLAHCHLKRLHSLIYQKLLNLESLDLQDNQLGSLAPEEFRHLRNLRVLRLDGNQLNAISERAFDGHNLAFLGLSRNHLTRIATCSFCNASIEELDLSRNRLQVAEGDPFRPLASSLDRLDLSSNPLSGGAIAGLVRTLQRLSVLKLEGLGLQHIPHDAFKELRGLRVLVLRHNRLSSLPPGLLEPLRGLESLDLSSNRFRGIPESELRQFESLQTLSRLALHDNPWVCQDCHVQEFARWLSRQPLDCGPCPTCTSPARLSGRQLSSLTEALDACDEPVLQQRVSRTESQVGLIVAIIIIMVLVTIIVAAIIVYRRQGAVYYTHEDERGSVQYDGGKDVNGKRPSIVTSLDDIKDSKHGRG
ncbi:platelet glycoprotein V-like [Ornithodoros turicata]|uniref:platelet glycoprotein V-like n=1 Tax=Ornithodoros turicata TaxID=34597 RepID=UPI0031394443